MRLRESKVIRMRRAMLSSVITLAIFTVVTSALAIYLVTTFVEITPKILVALTMFTSVPTFVTISCFILYYRLGQIEESKDA